MGRALVSYLLFRDISNLNVVFHSEKASGEATSTPLSLEFVSQDGVP
jgi:hypothetical protein